MTGAVPAACVQQALPNVVSAADCGATAAFLLSGLSSSISGQTIPVDAGLTIQLYNRSFTADRTTQ